MPTKILGSWYGQVPVSSIACMQRGQTGVYLREAKTKKKMLPPVHTLGGAEVNSRVGRAAGQHAGTSLLVSED